jgi:CBS domain containing-hemolysin-like protein
MTTPLLVWIFVVGTLASLLFSTLSYALRTISRVHLEEALIIRHRTRALEAILHARFDLALTASILRLVSNVAAIVAIGIYFLNRYSPDPAPHPFAIFGWTVLISVPVMMIFSIAIPQAWAKYAGEALLARTWPLLRLAHLITWPLIRILKIFDEMVRRLAGDGVSLGEEPETAAEKVSEEILSMVAEGTAEGAVDREQQKMIEGVILFHDHQVAQIMTPRTDIIALDVNTPVLEARDRILKDGLSRVPVYEGSLDNILGILYAKDLLPFLNIAGGTAVDDAQMELRRLLRPAYFVPRTKPLHDLLREFRAQHVHIAIVLDEYGGTCGLVTTEDIVEEIVGNIADEYERPAPEELKRLTETSVEVDARMNITDLNRALTLQLPEDADYQSLGGFVLSTLGVIPPKGETFKHDGLTITVLDAEPRRVKKLRLDLPQSTATMEPATPAPLSPEI